jgi:hypothetical protein
MWPINRDPRHVFCKNSVLNSILLREFYLRSYCADPFTLKPLQSVVSVLKLKSILGVGPKVKDSIEDFFK